ncbi:MAG: hypothetical protein ABIH71_05925 [Candidatus Omnitrophota bacterium]|nr:hypothetical protein [Candidatus Omnitrophota bacterium]
MKKIILAHIITLILLTINSNSFAGEERVLHEIIRPDIKAKIYRKMSNENILFVSLYNPTLNDMKVTFKLHSSHPEDCKIFTAFIQSGSAWGKDKEIGYKLDDIYHTISILNISKGQLREYEMITLDEEEKEITYKIIEFEKL